jgi:transposase-like protein
VGTNVLSMLAKGVDDRGVSVHFEDICGASLTRRTVSRTTDRVLTEIAEWMARPLGKGLRRGVRWSSTP